MKNRNMIFLIVFIIIVTIIIVMLKNNIDTNEKNNSDLDNTNIKNANIVYNEQTQMYDIYDKDGIYKQSVPKSADLEIYEINPDYEAYDPGIY